MQAKTIKSETGKPSQLSPKEIVVAAYKYLSDIASAQKISEVRIEELEQIEDNKFWNVVLSYDAIGEFPFEKKREYKEFKIDAKSGIVIYMKIRKI